MKRLLTIFLSFLLIIGCIYGVIPAGASNVNPTGTNLIAGGDFLSGTGYITSTTLPSATDSFVTGLNYKTWFRASSLSDAIGNDSDSRGNYLHTKQYAFHGASFETAKNYTLTFDIRGTAGTKNVQLYICDATVRGTALTIGDVTKNGIANPTTDRVIIEKSSTWTTYTITFTVTALLDTAKYYSIGFYDVDYSSSNPITLDLDNVSLYDNTAPTTIDINELVKDGGFETTQNTYAANSSVTNTLQVLKQQAGTTTPADMWHQSQGSSTQFTRISGEDKHGGSASVIVNPYLYQGIDVKAGSVYRLEFWAKAKNYNILTFRLVSAASRATAINTEGTRTATLATDWVKYSYTVKMPAAASGVTLLSFFTKTATETYGNFNANDAWVDDVSLKELYTLSATAEVGGSASVSSASAIFGEQVIFTALPDTGKNFLGWYLPGNTTPVSTDAVYTATVSGNLSLVAKFSTPVEPPVPEDPNNLLFDGTFSQTDSIIMAESYDTVTYSSAHIWYQAPGSSAVQTEGNNKVAKLSQWLYQSVSVLANTTYRLTYKAKTTVADATVGVSIRALKNRGTILKIVPNQIIDSNGEWKTYTTDFTIGALNATYTDYTLGITGTIGAGILVDDLIFQKLFSTSVVTEGSGTASVSKNAVISGEEITFTATPTGNATFLGWYSTGGLSPVSTNAVYTVAVTENLALTAKFSGISVPEDPDDPDNLLHDGKFTKTSSIASAESYTTVTYDSAHSWYQAPGSTSVQTTGGNSYAALSEWLYQSIKVEANTTYLLTFKSKSNVSGQAFSGVIRALKDRGKTLKNVFSYTTDGEGVWKEYSILFTVDGLLSGYTDYALGLMGKSGAGVLIDDVVFKKATGTFFTVTSAAFRGGRATVNSSVALPGGTATFTATPDSGNTFRGWYISGNTAKPPVSTALVYTTAVSSNLFIVAVFDGPGIPVENFSFINPGAEAGNTSGWTASATNATLSVSSTEKHSGKNSLKFVTTAEKRYITTSEGILLKGYCTYELSVWIKSTTIYPRVQLFTGTSYVEGQNDFIYGETIRSGYTVKHRVGGDAGALEETSYSAKSFTKTPDKYAGAQDGWVQYQMSFSTKSADAGTVVKFCIRNNSGIGEMYVDDLKVTETPIDIYVSPTDQTYCQWIYNQVENPSFEDKTTDNDWGSKLRSGWNIKNAGGALGKNYLTVSSSGVYYKKIKVSPDTEYHLGVSLKAAVKNGSYIAIASNQNGTLFNEIKGKPASYVTPRKYNNTWERVGFKFTIPQNITEVYLVIYNPSGELSVDNICFFKGKYASITDPNDYTVHVGYDYDGVGYTGDDGFEEGIVPGGDNTAQSLAVFLTIMIASAWVMMATRKREAKGER